MCIYYTYLRSLRPCKVCNVLHGSQVTFSVSRLDTSDLILHPYYFTVLHKSLGSQTETGPTLGSGCFVCKVTDMFAHPRSPVLFDNSEGDSSECSQGSELPSCGQKRCFSFNAVPAFRNEHQNETIYYLLASLLVLSCTYHNF